MNLRTKLGLIITGNLFGGIYFSVILPVGGLLMTERGVPLWQIGVLGGIPWAATLAATLFMPALLQRFHARPLYLASRWLGLIAALVFLSTNNLACWALGYLCLGLSGGISWVIGDALLATLPPPEQRAKVLSLYMFIINFTIIIGPLIVTVLGTGQLAFVACLLIALANFIMAYLLPFPAREPAQEGARGFSLLMHVGAPIAGLLFVGISSGSFEGSAVKMLPVQAFSLGYNEHLAALAAVASGAGNIVSQLLLMRLLKHFTPHQLVVPGSVLLALSSLLIAPLSGHMLSYFGILFVAGGIAGSLYTLVVLDVTSDASSQQGMQRISCIAASYTAGGFFGPLVVGFAMEYHLVWGYSLAMAAITLAALGLYLRMPARS